MSISALQTGINGINAGLNSMRRDAQQIAQATTEGSAPTTDQIKPLVNLKQDQRQVEISTQVVKAADETIGSLLDILA